MGIWVVVVVLGVGAGAAAVLSRRRSDDVEPTVREFAELSRPAPRLVGGAGGHEQLDDPLAGRSGDGVPASGAPEPIRARSETVVADANGELVDLQRHVAACRALGPHRRHRTTPPHHG